MEKILKKAIDNYINSSKCRLNSNCIKLFHRIFDANLIYDEKFQKFICEKGDFNDNSFLEIENYINLLNTDEFISELKNEEFSEYFRESVDDFFSPSLYNKIKLCLVNFYHNKLSCFIRELEEKEFIEV